MSWIMQGERPFETDSIKNPDTPFIGDSPYTFWRIDANINNGKPYVGLMIGVPALNPEPPVVNPNIFYGNNQTQKIFYGNTAVSSVYFGTHKIF